MGKPMKSATMKKYFSILCSIFLLTTIIYTTSAETPPILSMDAESFEQADSWSCPGSSSIFTTDVEFHSGANSFYIYGENAQELPSIAVLGLTIGKKYLVNAYMKVPLEETQSGGVTSTDEAWIATDVEGTEYKTFSLSSEQWTKITTVFEATAETAVLTPIVNDISSWTNMMFLLDDLTVEEYAVDDISIVGSQKIARGKTTLYQAMLLDNLGNSSLGGSVNWSISPDISGISVDEFGNITVNAEVAVGTEFELKAELPAFSVSKTKTITVDYESLVWSYDAEDDYLNYFEFPNNIEIITDEVYKGQKAYRVTPQGNAGQGIVIYYDNLKLIPGKRYIASMMCKIPNDSPVESGGNNSFYAINADETTQSNNPTLTKTDWTQVMVCFTATESAPECLQFYPWWLDIGQSYLVDNIELYEQKIVSAELNGSDTPYIGDVTPYQCSGRNGLGNSFGLESVSAYWNIVSAVPGVSIDQEGNLTVGADVPEGTKITIQAIIQKDQEDEIVLIRDVYAKKSELNSKVILYDDTTTLNTANFQFGWTWIVGNPTVTLSDEGVSGGKAYHVKGTTTSAVNGQFGYKLPVDQMEIGKTYYVAFKMKILNGDAPANMYVFEDTALVRPGGYQPAEIPKNEWAIVMVGFEHTAAREVALLATFSDSSYEYLIDDIYVFEPGYVTKATITGADSIESGLTKNYKFEYSNPIGDNFSIENAVVAENIEIETDVEGIAIDDEGNVTVAASVMPGTKFKLIYTVSGSEVLDGEIKTIKEITVTQREAGLIYKDDAVDLSKVQLGWSNGQGSAVGSVSLSNDARTGGTAYRFTGVGAYGFSINFEDAYKNMKIGETYIATAYIKLPKGCTLSAPGNVYLLPDDRITRDPNNDFNLSDAAWNRIAVEFQYLGDDKDPKIMAFANFDDLIEGQWVVNGFDILVDDVAVYKKNASLSTQIENVGSSVSVQLINETDFYEEVTVYAAVYDADRMISVDLYDLSADANSTGNVQFEVVCQGNQTAKIMVFRNVGLTPIGKSYPLQ